MTARRPVLVIGGGWIGRRHLDVLRRLGGIEVAICETNADRRAALLREGVVNRAHAHLDEALEHAWAAVVIATPAHTHTALGTRLARHGIPTLVEEPVAVALEGVDVWQELADARGVPVMVGYVFRSHPLLIAARDAILAGAIGRPVQVVAVRGGHLPARRPDYAETYYANRAEGGGVLHDILSHVFNAAEWLVGPIDRLAVDAAHACLPGVEVEDTVHVIARHGPILGCYAVNQHQPIAEFSLTVNGTAGSVRIAFHEHRWQIASQPEGGWRSHPMAPLDPTEWFALQARAFLDVLDHGATPPCSLAAGITTLHAILAAMRAAASGNQWVEVDHHVPSPAHGF